MPDTPWIGLLALMVMLIIPFLPSWLFEGPRVVKHRPRRHVCGDCGALWTDGHACAFETYDYHTPLRGQLSRLAPSHDGLSRDDDQAGGLLPLVSRDPQGKA